MKFLAKIVTVAFVKILVRGLWISVEFFPNSAGSPFCLIKNAGYPRRFCWRSRLLRVGNDSDEILQKVN